MDLLRLSRAARAAVDRACKEAVALQHGRLETVHLVLALLDDRTAARVVLERLGVGAGKVRAEAASVYDGPELERASDLERSGDEARETLELAVDEADAGGDFEVLPAHLFCAATSSDRWTAYRALIGLGVDVERARREVTDLIKDEQQGTVPLE